MWSGTIQSYHMSIAATRVIQLLKILSQYPMVQRYVVTKASKTFLLILSLSGCIGLFRKLLALLSRSRTRFTFTAMNSTFSLLATVLGLLMLRLTLPTLLVALLLRF